MDVTEPNTLRALEGHKVVINLAAVHRDDVKPISLYDAVNVEGARNLCQAAEKYGIKAYFY